MIFPVHFSAKQDVNTEDAIIIETYNEDITGSGQPDKIELKGKLFSDGSQFYQNIWIDITNEQEQKHTIYTGSGYNPVLKFIDLNGDQIKDILYQSPTGGSGGLYHSELHTFANGTHKQLKLPAHASLTGQFLDDYQVEIQLSPIDEPIIVNRSEQKKEYQSLGIYDDTGKLTAPKSLMIDPIAFYEPVFLSDTKGYGLKSYQRINGAYHADGIGTIETTWYNENGRWVILETEWIPLQSS